MNATITHVCSLIYKIGQFEVFYYIEFFGEAQITAFLSYFVSVAFFEYLPCDVGFFVHVVVPQIFGECCFCFVFVVVEAFLVVVVSGFECCFCAAYVYCCFAVVVFYCSLVDYILCAAVVWYWACCFVLAIASFLFGCCCCF